MPDDLGELMGRAAADPVAPLDPDAVWKRGSRQRMARRAALALPIIVLVAVIGGLVVVSSDNDGGDGTEDSLFAGLTADEQTVVDEYLRVLEAEGALTSFPDERAAVEYAWRVECFGAITPAELNALGAATTDLVGALSTEALVASADMAGVVGAGDLDDARAATDDAAAAYLATLDGLDDAAFEGEGGAVLRNAVDAARTRLDSVDTVRTAGDSRQLDSLNLATQHIEQASAVLAVMGPAAAQGEDIDLALGWGNHENLLRAQIAAAGWSSSLVDLLDPSTVTMDGGDQQSVLYDRVETEDQYVSRWNESASGSLKAALRNFLSTPETRALDSIANETLLAIERSPGTFEPDEIETSASEVYDLAHSFIPGYTEVADAAVAEVVAATADSSDPARDAAVAAACDLTGDAILDVDPSAVEEPVTTFVPLD